MTQTLLFVGGGIESLPGIERAREKGITTVVSDGSIDAPGLRAADHHFIASTYGIDETIAGAREFSERVAPLDGVICVATDVPLTVASVADALGLPGIPVDAAGITSEKMLMKDRFKEDGLPIPWYVEIGSASDLDDAIAERGYPLIIKPVDSRGARGVRLLREQTHVVGAYEEAASVSPTGRVMLESYLAGPQLSTEALIINGVAHTIGYSDRNYDLLDVYAPNIIEDGGDLPSALPAAAIADVDMQMTRAAQSLGIENGVLKGDIVVTKEGAAIVEVASRLSGGYFCSHLIPLATGIDFLGAAIDIALGWSIDIDDYVRSGPSFVCQRYLFPEPGIVKSVKGAEDVAAMDGVEMCEVRVGPGEMIHPVNNHTARAGVIIATGDSRVLARERAKRAVSMIKFEIEEA